MKNDDELKINQKEDLVRIVEVKHSKWTYVLLILALLIIIGIFVFVELPLLRNA